MRDPFHAHTPGSGLCVLYMGAAGGYLLLNYKASHIALQNGGLKFSNLCQPFFLILKSLQCMILFEVIFLQLHHFLVIHLKITPTQMHESI